MDNKKTKDNKILITFILSLYFSFVTSYRVGLSFPLFKFFLIFLISFIIFKFILKKIDNFVMNEKEKKFKRKELLLYAGIIILILALAYITYYPALMVPDSYSQWKQAQTNLYFNWHPVIHTLIFFKLPSLIYDGPEAFSLFQLLYIGGILLYFCFFLRKHFLNVKGTILVLLLIMINPLFFEMSMYLWKDTGFSWTMFLGMIYVLNIVLSNGTWINKTSNMVLFVLTCFGIMLFRHNGIVNVGALLLILMIAYRKKWKVYLSLLIILFAFRTILYGPIFDYLGIPPTGGKSELLGVVSSQIAYMYHEGNIISQEDIDLLTELAPKETWEKNYSIINFNYMKWNTEYNDWADRHFNDILKLWLKLGTKYPISYINEYLNVTSPIWKISDGFNKFIYAENAGFIPSIYNDYCNTISESILKYFVLDYGMSLFVILFSLAITFNKVKKCLEKYLPYVLVLSNTFTIMFLITGEEDRYVYSQVICAIPLLVYSLYLKKEKNNTKKVNAE